MKEKETKSKIKKPLFKRWWFWVIVVVILAAIFGSTGTKDTVKDEAKDTANSIEQQTEEKQEESTSNSALDDISFNVRDVRNDVTGNWRVAVISENIELQDYALDYYKKYFESDNEIHAIVNFNFNTTTKISVIGNVLDVSVYEYVDKEEHDAKMLFSGMLLKEYEVNKDTGDIKEVK